MKISDDVLEILSGAHVLGIDQNYLRIEQQLERKLYLKVNQVLEACGGKWDRKLKAHIFEGSAQAHLDTILALGEVTTAQEMGYFPTPAPLARQLVEMAEVRLGHLVLEPSAGEGAIVDYIVGAGAACVALERDPRRRDILIGKVIGIHDWTASVHVERSCGDFMEYVIEEPFDRVVMNPPFCKVGLGDHLDHVRHAFSMLVSGGVLVSVLPNGVLFRQDKRHREFREWVTGASSNGWQSIELPEDSFKASGTSVRTCALKLVHP